MATHKASQLLAWSRPGGEGDQAHWELDEPLHIHAPHQPLWRLETTGWGALPGGEQEAHEERRIDKGEVSMPLRDEVEVVKVVSGGGRGVARGNAQ